MIANYDALVSHGQTEVRRVALDIVEAVMRDAYPGKALRSMMQREGSIVRFGDREYDLSQYEHVYIIGVGKGAQSFVEVLADAVGDRLDGGIVVIKEGEPRADIERGRVIESDHPLPTSRSVAAAEAVAELADAAGPNDLVLTAVTGGATSLVLLPPEGLLLEDIMKVSSMLLKSGANIGEMNTVRRHLCQLKGGGLLSRIAPAENATFSMVTVPPWIIPWPDLCVADPTTFADAINILKVFEVWDGAPDAIKAYLERGAQGLERETLKTTEGIRTTLFNVLDPAALCEAGARKAEALGFKPMILSRYMEGEAKDVGIALAGLASEISLYGRPWEAPCALLIGGEVTVTVRGQAGVGGPNQEFVLGFAKALGSAENVAAVAIDTDGNDGSTDIAGGIVDGMTMRRALDMGVNVHAALRDHDSSSALTSLGDAVYTGPTGTNVLDFKVIVIGKGQEK